MHHKILKAIDVHKLQIDFKETDYEVILNDSVSTGLIELMGVIDEAWPHKSQATIKNLLRPQKHWNKFKGKNAKEINGASHSALTVGVVSYINMHRQETTI